MASRPTPSIRSGSSSTKVGSTILPSDRPSALSLAQRLLSTSPTTPLPPLFPIPDAELAQLNDQVYRFLALALRAFVLTWWSKLSPRDKEFLPQITVVVQHVIREVHLRLSKADLTELIMNQLPLLLKQHYADYRQARSKANTSYAAIAPNSLPHIFHRLQPHIAVKLPDDGAPWDSTSSLVDPAYLSASVDVILKACLPPEDSSSAMERHIVREIIVGPVLGSVVSRLTQPWFIHNILTNVIRRSDKVLVISNIARAHTNAPPATQFNPNQTRTCKIYLPYACGDFLHHRAGYFNILSQGYTTFAVGSAPCGGAQNAR